MQALINSLDERVVRLTTSGHCHNHFPREIHETNLDWGRCGTQKSMPSGVTRGRIMRSKIRCVTELCNSHYISRFAAFFIVTRPERSTAKRIHKVFLLVCETLKQPLFTLCGTFLRKIIHANTSKFHHLGTNQQGIQKKKKRTERVNCTKTNRRPAL